MDDWGELEDARFDHAGWLAYRREITQRMRDRRKADPERNAAHLARRRAWEATYRAKRKQQGKPK